MKSRARLWILWDKRWIVLAVFLFTLIATIAFTYAQTPVYQASATFIITPADDYPAGESPVNAEDALGSRTDIAGTYAQVAASDLIKEEAANQLGLSQVQRRNLAIDSRLLPATNVLVITVEGSDPQLVQLFADTVGVRTSDYVQRLDETFDLKALDRADLPVAPIRPNRRLNLALGVVAGLGLGIASAFLAHYLEIFFPSTASDDPPVAAGRGAAAKVRRIRVLSRRRAAWWVVVAILALALMAGIFAVWFTGQRTSSAAVPIVDPTEAPLPTATWAISPTAAPHNTDMPAPTPSPTYIVELWPTPCPVPAGWEIYVVRAGDSLPVLALKYGISAAQITEANCLDGSEFSEVRTLYLPPQPETPALTSIPTDIPTSAWPGVSSTRTPQVVATVTSAPASTPTPRPVSRPTQSSPSPTKPPAGTGSLLAPVLLAPSDGQGFTENADIVLAWQSVGALPPDTYYVITVAFSHLGQTWYDEVPWTQDTSWRLSGHRYLLDLSDDGQFRWSVQLVRQTGIAPDGKPVGLPVSPASTVRSLGWKRETSGTGPTPPVPPP